MVAVVGPLALGLAAVAAAVNGAIGVVKLATGAIGKAGDSAGAITKAFTGLDISLKHLTSTFKQSITAADVLQKRNLALGRDFAGFRKSFDNSIDKMPGVLSEKLGAIMSSVEVGLRGNTAQTHSLIQFTRMTGGNFKGLATELERVQTGLGLSNASLENLSVVTRVATDKYGVAADRMIRSIDQLSAQTKQTILMSSQGSSFSKAMIELSGKLGGRAGGAQNAIQDILFGGSAGLGQAAVLGLLGARQRAQHGGSDAIVGASLDIISAWPR